MTHAVAKRKGRDGPSPAKLQQVDALQKDFRKYPVVGLVNLYKMPAAQLQEMRLKLDGKARIITAKKAVVNRAIDGCGIKELRALDEPLMKPSVQPALIFSEMNPFLLFKFIQQNKSEAPAKIGDLAPKDIMVKAGDTGMPPGPAIGTLSAAGLKAKVVAGKIHVMEDKIVTKSGEPVRAEVATVLNMMNIKPMEIGLDLIATYEGGIVYGKDVLRIDETEFAQRLNTAIISAINLSINAGYLTKETAPLAVQKAYREARELALVSGAYEKGVIEELLVKHVREYAALKATGADAASTSTPQATGENNS